MLRRITLSLVLAVVAVVSVIVASSAGASGLRRVRFLATLDGSVRTTWSVPDQLLSTSCYHDEWEQGQGTENMTVHMSATRALAAVYSPKSVSINLGNWQLYGGTAHARENVTRQGQTTVYDRPGNCGQGGNGPTTQVGPGGCGTRSGTPQVSLSMLGSSRKWQVYVADTKGQIAPYTDCPVFYGSNDAVSSGLLSPTLGRIAVKNLLSTKKRRIILHFQHHWHHGRGTAVTNYFIADTTSYWTLELTRQP